MPFSLASAKLSLLSVCSGTRRFRGWVASSITVLLFFRCRPLRVNRGGIKSESNTCVTPEMSELRLGVHQHSSEAVGTGGLERQRGLAGFAGHLAHRSWYQEARQSGGHLCGQSHGRYVVYMK